MATKPKSKDKAIQRAKTKKVAHSATSKAEAVADETVEQTTPIFVPEVVDTAPAEAHQEVVDALHAQGVAEAETKIATEAALIEPLTDAEIKAVKLGDAETKAAIQRSAKETRIALDPNWEPDRTSEHAKIAAIQK